MPLVIKAEGDLSKPVIICDHCGQEITEASQGNYQWKMSKLGKGVEGVVFFTHKSCCHAFEALNPAPCWGAMELDCLLVYLANNLKVNWEKARKKAARLDSIG
jgi:hypothetical protein